MVSDHNAFLLFEINIKAMSLFQSMSEEFRNNVLMEGVDNVEHILTVTNTAFWVSIWEVMFDSIKSHEFIIQVFHAQLIKLCDFNMPDVTIFQKLLGAAEDLLCIVFRELIIWWHIIL